MKTILNRLRRCYWILFTGELGPRKPKLNLHKETRWLQKQRDRREARYKIPQSLYPPIEIVKDGKLVSENVIHSVNK